MLKMMGSFTIIRWTSMLPLQGIKPSKEQLLAANALLNTIPKV